MDGYRAFQIEALHELVTQIPDDNLPLLNEAALLLSESSPPWEFKAAYEDPLIWLLERSQNHEAWVEDVWVPAAQWNVTE